MTRSRLAAATIFAIVIALAGSATPAHAMHIGFYGTYGAGQASGDVQGSFGGFNDFNWDSDTEHAGFGFALEAPMGYRLSYRLGLGWEHIDGSGGRGSGELEGFVFDNDFTYDLVAGPVSRFWIGPEFRLGFFRGNLDNVPGGDQDFIALGIGPVLGFDLALGPSAALSWKAGYLYSWYYNDNYESHNDVYDDAQMYDGHAYVSMAVLFRLWGGPPAPAPPGTYQPQGRW